MLAPCGGPPHSALKEEARVNRPGKTDRNCISKRCHPNRSDRFREIREIRGGFAGHEFHELARIPGVFYSHDEFGVVVR